MKVIETDRLILEPVGGSRLEEFVALTADPRTMEYWSPIGPFTRDEAERRFAQALRRSREHGFGRRWIILKDTGEGIGFTETKKFGTSCRDVLQDEIEIGWMLERSEWGRGYGTEAGRAIRDEAFERLELGSIVAVHHPGNPASGRIMEKLGMEFERDVVDDTGWPYRLHRITRERWAEVR
jgi:RimJ/RimL family protein N-acetyltransferase